MYKRAGPVLATTFMLLAGVTVIAQLSQQEQTLVTIAKGIEHWEASLSSGQALSIWESWGREPNGQGEYRGKVMMVRCIFDGPFFYEQTVIAWPEGREPDRDAYTIGWDGNSGYIYFPRRATAAIADLTNEWLTGGPWLTDFFNFCSVYAETLSDVVDPASSKLEAEEDVFGYKTFKVKQVTKDIIYEWWIAPDLDFLCLKERRQLVLLEPPALQEEVVLPAVNIADIKAPVTIPLIRELRFFRNGQLVHIWRATLYEAYLGEAVTRDPFSPVFPLGTTVREPDLSEHVEGPPIVEAVERCKSREWVAALFDNAKTGGPPLAER